MTLKNDETSEEKLTRNSQKCTLQWTVFDQIIMFDLKQYRGVMVDCTQD